MLQQKQFHGSNEASSFPISKMGLKIMYLSSVANLDQKFSLKVTCNEYKEWRFWNSTL